VETEAQWHRLCEVVGLLDLADDPRFCNFQMRAEHRRELLEILNAQFKERSRDEWLKRLEDADIAVGPVYRIDEVFQDPQVLHSGMIQAIGHPTIGTLRLVGFPVKLNRTRPIFVLYPPWHGEHTEEILRELGCSPEEIAAVCSEVGLAAARECGRA
jgi:formyl-CoA transferase